MKFDEVYDEVKRIAHAHLAKHAAQTLSTTDLVHEAYIKLATSSDAGQDRTHLISLVVRALRQVLIDAARKRGADKRGGDPLRVTLDPAIAAADSGHDFLALDQAIAQLKSHNERMGLVVELHFFGGVEFNEIAELLNVDRRTVTRDWTAARVLIADALGGQAKP
jgi:RNA polymerase sigma factor (TIGR02999 family)